MIYLELLLSIILYNAWAALVARINSRNITWSFFFPPKMGISTEKILLLDIFSATVQITWILILESISNPSWLITLLHPPTQMNILCWIYL